MRPGDYLFLNGQVCAYSSRLIDFKRDKVSLSVGIAAGIAALHWPSTACSTGHSELRASRLPSRPPVLRGSNHRKATARNTGAAAGREAAIDEVGLAVEVLGIPPSATQDEVKARFRSLAKEWHPDRFTNNAPMLAEAGVRMAQINVAYSVISKVRGWQATKQPPTDGQQRSGIAAIDYDDAEHLRVTQKGRQHELPKQRRSSTLIRC